MNWRIALQAWCWSALMFGGLDPRGRPGARGPRRTHARAEGKQAPVPFVGHALAQRDGAELAQLPHGGRL